MALARLESSHALFAKRSPINIHEIENFLAQFTMMLPEGTSLKDQASALRQLRKCYSQCPHDFLTFINNGNFLNRIMSSWLKQSSSTDISHTRNDSLIRFLALAGIVPNAAAAAATGASYVYVQGQPPGGIDLCATTLVSCIQGHLTAIGQAWHQGMPQIARFLENNITSAASDCIAHPQLAGMLSRAYRGTTELANCTLQSVTALGTNVTVFATGVDTITCNLMGDSLIGFADDCKTPSPTDNTTLILGLTLGLGLPLLAILACSLCMWWNNCCKKTHGYSSIA